MIYITIWTSGLADMNVGVVQVLFSITPLLVACAEYVIYKYSLSCNYLIGLILMVISAALLSFNTLMNNLKSHK